MSGLAARLVVERPGFRLDVDLAAAPGEVVALVGPNGAGKSTALRALAGLLALDEGRVELDGRVLADAATRLHRPAHERGVGVVFQDYLLFPHLSVLDNVAFGLTARGRPRAEARAVAAGWLERVGLAALAAARPRTLSGGQAQRVALARALAPGPGLLLLDEPLAALDVRTRLLVRGELRRHLQAFGGAAVVVTHDPVDAAVLADRLVVVEDGRVVQTGTPAAVAARPRTDYVARLVGLNLLGGDGVDGVVRLPGGGRVHGPDVVGGPVRAAFRPAAVALFTARPEGSPRNLWAGRVTGLEPHGAGVRVEVAGAPDAGSSILAEVTPAAVAELDLRPGSPVWAAVKASDVTVYPDGPAAGP
ncbi:sulfate/molybdate ABC transporter ATP-binding protein [Microlunatus capsulatus]|uniref:Molybdate transport system ATP-binding protein n=1 Tax=Microlunatus capsulatus TaxID=99117 RepID=A0ABS4Z6A9_9ACTN|nr:ABC transporter ATP-binding protein [Microlunatus capsulatus]MBP2416589.1 molybdate transport system ATP-binding protein [Microlunatus capsulatus]